MKKIPPNFFREVPKLWLAEFSSENQQIKEVLDSELTFLMDVPMEIIEGFQSEGSSFMMVRIYSNVTINSKGPVSIKDVKFVNFNPNGVNNASAIGWLLTNHWQLSPYLPPIFPTNPKIAAAISLQSALKM